MSSSATTMATISPDLKETTTSTIQFETPRSRCKHTAKAEGVKYLFISPTNKKLSPQVARMPLYQQSVARESTIESSSTSELESICRQRRSQKLHSKMHSKVAASSEHSSTLQRIVWPSVGSLSGAVLCHGLTSKKLLRQASQHRKLYQSNQTSP